MLVGRLRRGRRWLDPRFTRATFLVARVTPDVKAASVPASNADVFAVPRLGPVAAVRARLVRVPVGQNTDPLTKTRTDPARSPVFLTVTFKADP